MLQSEATKYGRRIIGFGPPSRGTGGKEGQATHLRTFFLTSEFRRLTASTARQLAVPNHSTSVSVDVTRT